MEEKTILNTVLVYGHKLSLLRTYPKWQIKTKNIFKGPIKTKNISKGPMKTKNISKMTNQN